MKTCSDCAETKSLGEFYSHRGGSVYGRCKPCHYARTQAWRARNREKIRALDRARYPKDRARKLAEKRMQKYGITQEEYEALIARQGGVCPICLEPFADSVGRSGGWDIASVDHDHATGKVRGVLHRRCNLALEFMLSEDETRRAREYLEAD